MDLKHNAGDMPSMSDTFPKIMIQGLNELRTQKELCDITINVGNKNFYVHKLVLSACSPYFKAMFTNNLLESKEPLVTLHDIDEDAMEMIIDLAYTRRFDITDSNVQSLLAASNLLQIEEVSNRCCEYMKRNLDPTNCIGIRDVAERYSYCDLCEFAKAFILDNFEEVCENEEFLSLSLEKLIDIISKDVLNVKYEEIVHGAVMKWAAHGDRSVHIPAVNKHVRWNQVDTSYLVANQNSDVTYLLNGKIAKESVGLNEPTELYGGGRLTEEDRHFFCPRYCSGNGWKPRSRHRLNKIESCEKLYVATGYLSRQSSALHRYDPKTDMWTNLGSMTQVRDHCLAALNNVLYNLSRYGIERYHPHTGKWTQGVASSTSRHISAGVATLDGYLYAMGGADGNLVDRYDPVADIWTTCAPLIRPRYVPRVAVLDKCIYAIGGTDGSRWCDPTVERYDPRTDQWKSVSSMTRWRRNFGCTSYNGCIYIAGGDSYPRFTQYTERYDPRNDKWEPIRAMAPYYSKSEFNSSLDLFTIDGLIYALHDHPQFLDVYDPAENRWYNRARMSFEPWGISSTILAE